MASKKNKEEDLYKLKKIITIIFLLLTFVMPLLGIVGVVFMWLWMKWNKWVKVFITFPFFALFILAPLMILNYTLFVRPISIQGEAMSPNFTHGQYYISKVLHSNDEVKRGDVIVFKSPSNPNIDFFKRIVGLPYEKLMIKDGKVYVNGVLLDESEYLSSETVTQMLEGGFITEGQEIVIPASSYFVMGDNRQRSSDSRVFGPISRESIKSRMAFCYFRCD